MPSEKGRFFLYFILGFIASSEASVPGLLQVASWTSIQISADKLMYFHVFCDTLVLLSCALGVPFKVCIFC